MFVECCHVRTLLAAHVCVHVLPLRIFRLSIRSSPKAACFLTTLTLLWTLSLRIMKGSFCSLDNRNNDVLGLFLEGKTFRGRPCTVLGNQMFTPWSLSRFGYKYLKNYNKTGSLDSEWDWGRVGAEAG